MRFLSFMLCVFFGTYIGWHEVGKEIFISGLVLLEYGFWFLDGICSRERGDRCWFLGVKLYGCVLRIVATWGVWFERSVVVFSINVLGSNGFFVWW